MSRIEIGIDIFNPHGDYMSKEAITSSVLGDNPHGYRRNPYEPRDGIEFIADDYIKLLSYAHIEQATKEAPISSLNRQLETFMPLIWYDFSEWRTIVFKAQRRTLDKLVALHGYDKTNPEHIQKIQDDPIMCFFNQKLCQIHCREYKGKTPRPLTNKDTLPSTHYLDIKSLKDHIIRELQNTPVTLETRSAQQYLINILKGPYIKSLRDNIIERLQITPVTLKTRSIRASLIIRLEALEQPTTNKIHYSLIEFMHQCNKDESKRESAFNQKLAQILEDLPLLIPEHTETLEGIQNTLREFQSKCKKDMCKRGSEFNQKLIQILEELPRLKQENTKEINSYRRKVLTPARPEDLALPKRAATIVFGFLYPTEQLQALDSAASIQTVPQAPNQA